MKRKKWNRILSVFIAVALMISALPINVIAEAQETLVEEVGATAEEVKREETVGNEENQLESSNVEVQEVEENKEETTETTEEKGSVTEETTVQSEEESQVTESSSETNEAKGEDSVGLQLYSVDNLNSLDALVELAGKTDKASVSVDENTKKITVDAGGLILLSNANVNFSGYTIYLSTLSGGYADLTQTITITETSTENGTQTTTSRDYSFQGLGSKTNPFSGTLESQDGSYGVILNVPFFSNVDFTKARLNHFTTLKIQRKNDTTAMLAENISGVSDDTWNSLTIQAEKYSITVGGTTTEYLPGELIAAIADGTSLSLGTVTYSDGAAVSPVSANAGLLCNTMNTGSSLSVGMLSVSGTVTVTATNGSAGGLVGLMNSGASLTVNTDAGTASVTIGSNFTITGQNAGGLIGSGTDIKLGGTKVNIDGATVKGSVSAGGLIGSHITGGAEFGFVSYEGATTSTPKVNNVTLETTANDAYAGGLFGVLDLRSNFTISNASVTSSIGGSKSYYGGLVGQVKGESADSLRALTISGTGTSNPSTSTSVNLNGYAGAVAVIGDDGNTPVYVQISGAFGPTFSGVDKSDCFGGVAAYLKIDSVLELNAAFTPTGCTNIPKGGGVLGNAERGSTLCLGGTTDLSGTQFNNINEYTGQIVGTQESALIYAKSDWKLIRQTSAQELDDIGTYGSVIRLGGNMGMGTPSDTSGLSSDLISQNETTHKTEFLAKEKVTLTDNTFTISSVDQLALLAIEEQTKCAFDIFGTGSTDYYLKSNPNITLAEKISLAHTGITGLQRDNGACAEYSGTLDGQNHTLTIAAGEIYGYRGTEGTLASKDTAGSGQIHGHTQVGFFSQANATVMDLSVGGGMNLRFRTKATDTSTTYLAGGLVAKNTGTSTYTNVTTSVNIQYQGTTSGSIGGLVGLGTELTFANCTGNAEIDAGNSAVYAGGLIGQYTGATLSISGTKLSGTMTATGANHARLGGLVSRIAKGSYDAVNVTMTGITVNGQTITGTNIQGETKFQGTASETKIPASCGGLLGYEWNNAIVTFGEKNASPRNGLTVTGSSSVTVDGTTETAGLVYAATGYWQVNDIQLQSLSVTSGSGDLGLLICRGWRKDIPTTAGTTTKPYLLYLEETANNAYQIGNNVSVSNTGGYFDEWVVYTCEKTETITNNGNSVISIATASGDKVEGVRVGVGVDPTGKNCTSYQNRTSYGKIARANPNARYYYDLDVIRAVAKTSTPNSLVNTPGELVLWAVWRYAEKTNGETSNIANYFSTGDIGGASMTGDGNLIDLTGYAYYPITVDGFNLSITKINVKFANQEIEEAEGKTGENLDSLNRTTVGTTESHTQHYLMHSGLLLNYQNSTEGSDFTMTVSNVTFQGTIGKGPNGGSGALICGQLGGYTNAQIPKYAKLDIQSVMLGGVSVNADKTSAETGYAPLLVNRVGSYSSLTAQQVSIPDSSYTGVTSANNPAATSLIGHVGGESATNITLAFYNGIALNGDPNESIFSHATLLESFQYTSGSSGYYHFNKGESCTYGKEITETEEYSGQQLWYYDDQGEVVKDGDTDNFSEYLPYVCIPYEKGGTYHELEINIISPDLTDGCGTYDDPYIITSTRQLQFAAKFINGGNPQTGWKVNMVIDQEQIETGQGSNHSGFIFAAGTTDQEKANMRDYMRGAYYKIDPDLITNELTLNDFPGFGSVAYPFVGVIDGSGKTVKIDAANNESGLINVSYGSVVRNLTIHYTGKKTFSAKMPEDADNSKTAYAQSYFGGIIGTVLGGDSLVDDVKVTFANEFSITTSYDLQCAGGFVGLIQGGGVVFRNMGDTTRNSGYTGTNRTYYVDKYIGRVLDGYAINEEGSGTDASVTFKGKNYSIPNISSDTSIAWNEGNVTISKAQQMIILTDIINSGAASGGSAPAYDPDKARTRNADYSKIGNVSSAGDTAFTASRKDDTKLGTENYPYLIAKYAGGDGGFWTACTTGTLSLVFSPDSTKIDLSTYGNGYRGIGGRYYCNANGGTLTNNTPKIKAVTGNGVSLHVENNFVEYRADNFYANAVGGLFNVLRHEEADITDVNVYGTVKVCAGLGIKNTDKEETYLARAPVGGVIGRDYCTNDSSNELKLIEVSFGTGTADSRSVIYGECVTGGLIGSSGSYEKTVLDNGTSAKKNKTVLLLTNCSYQNVNITGGVASGGLVASGVPSSATFVNSSEKGPSNADNGIKISVTESSITCKNADIGILYNVGIGTQGTSNGVGGLIGFCGTTLAIEGTIKGTKTYPVSVQNITVHGAGDTLRARVGGLVGFMANNNSTNGSKANCTITYANLSDINIGMSGSYYDDNAGAIMGTWYSYGTLKCLDCKVDTADIQANSSGGIVGYAGRGPIHSVRITLLNITVRKRGYNRYAGGIGGQVGVAFYGQNILMKGFSYVDDYNVTNKNINDLGRFFGTGTYARLIGVTIQNTQSLPTYEIRNVENANLGTSNYVVYAGYNSNIVSSAITTASEIATKPSRAVSGIEDLHGDTIEPTTVRSAAADTAFYRNVGTRDKLTENICSTYNAQPENNIKDDFPVVLIDGDASVLKQYLNAATNGGFDSLRKYQSTNTSGGKVEVSIDRYLYDKDSGAFSEADEKAYPATLIYHSTTGEFTTTAQYDNQKDTFTLVTVTMTGYSASDKFVLHIPVIVRRMLQVDFMATMTSGTVFNKTDAFYSETKNHALASKGENITGYLTFHYNSNASDTANPASYDWQSYMEGGGDLLGYYKKTVNTGKDSLPAGTKITLIDCQNGDRRYYASVGEGKSSQLELFNGNNMTFTASDNTEFTPATLSDLLQITAKPAEDTATVKWVKLENETGATAKDKSGNYYRLYDLTKDTSIVNFYTLTVGNSSPTENYFVVISVPNAKSHRLTLYKNDMVWSNSTASPPLEVHQVHRYNSTLQNNEAISEASFNYLDNYQQSLVNNTDAESVQVQTTSAKVRISVSVTNTVTFTPTNYEDSDPLYQELVIALKKTEENTTTSVGLPSDAVAVTNTASSTTTENAVKLYAYYLDSSNYRHYFVWGNNGCIDKGTAREPAVSYAWSASADSSEMVLPFAVKTETGYQYIDLATLRKVSGGKFFLEAETTLEMSMASVMANNTIPYDAANGGTIENYTRIDATSILSFTKSGLSYSTLKGNVAGNKKYYLNTERKAILKLDYTNIDQLGINLREDQTAAIDTVLTLDFSNMEGFASDVTQFKTLSEADKVVFTISLQKKGDSSYEDASISNCLSVTKPAVYALQPNNKITITISKNRDGSYTYYNEQIGQFNIPISFAIKTEVREFANYRIRASVEMYTGVNPQSFDADVTKAFVTYTYAKINTNGYWQ
ncbi:MAG: beta strand repeat-containing protein [Erysipelotrichaceae bacterium]